MSIFLALVLYFIHPLAALAASEFTLNQSVNYQIQPNGDALVSHHFKLKNNFSQIYATQYLIDLSEDNLKNITATDDGGNILLKTTISDDHTRLVLKFNHPATGKDQVTQFKLNYISAHFAQAKGNTWEIQLPQFSLTNPSDLLDVYLSFPNTFGKISYSSLGPISTSPAGDQTLVHLTKGQLVDKKILLVLGNYQIFNFNLSYYLTNPNSYPVMTEIPLPPDTDNQKITLNPIFPSPKNIMIDPDGNWLAQFYLAAGQNLQLSVAGQAKITSSPKVHQISIDASAYLSEQAFWPTSSTQLQSIAAKLHSPQEVFDFVVSHLNYNYRPSNLSFRKGALVAFNNPNDSLCTEFADLFVTLARQAGIPSREVEGFAYSNNPKIKPISSQTDILHAWAQYYDDQSRQWKSVDPTWTKTTNGLDYFHTFDLNHLTFVVHGLNSQYPQPPGSYKSDADKQTVDVQFATTEIALTRLPPVIASNRLGVTLSNPNNSSLDHLVIKLDGQADLVDKLPPYSHYSFKVVQPLTVASLLPQNRTLNLTVAADDLSPTTYHPINYLYYLRLSIFLAVVILFLCLGGIILTR
jgi:hypothetical protein